MADSADWVPDACRLPSAERPLRVAEFSGLFAVVIDTQRCDPTRLDLVIPRDIEAAARDLARRESECCAFFTFEFDGAGDDVVMRIEVPVAHTEVLDAIERAQSQ